MLRHGSASYILSFALLDNLIKGGVNTTDTFYDQGKSHQSVKMESCLGLGDYTYSCSAARHLKVGFSQVRNASQSDGGWPDRQSNSTAEEEKDGSGMELDPVFATKPHAFAPYPFGR